MPDYMYDKLAEECQMPDAQLDDSPRPGAFYAALINDRWERVQCVRASKIELTSETWRRLMSVGPAAKSALAEKVPDGIWLTSMGTISTSPSKTQTVGGKLAEEGRNDAEEGPSQL
ncbi:hypothetical protein ANCCEY_15569 [Ancylostoma ceylanicum]|uniref:Uncharacterized protein n=1 Tax=Ancylostoma ceylanicum TaxID=53326 RepID=A0A0D6L4L5_9BILA|nr:hypothetical protein ANCCEY_15569 [Ancylostoma ceylanicum]